jgi:cytosine/adenosine deaminase-related metal-dependent hydrolase
MHFLETVYQRGWCDKNFPGGIIHYLKDIGLLSERLTLAHCTHARPDELEIIAQSNARIVTNFSSNMHLNSGLAPIADAHKCGCGIAVGVDGLAFDEDDDSIREMRLVQKVHCGQGFHRNWTCKEFFELVVRNGRHATGAPGTGELAPGHPADFFVIDFDRLDRDAITRVDPIDLFFARANATFIRSVVVDGRTIVENGAATGVDLIAIERELRAMYRVSFAKQVALQDAWMPFQRALENWYERAGCS